MKKTILLLTAAALASVILFSGAATAADLPENAMLVVPSSTAFDRKFQSFLDKNGAKLLHSYPPSVFIGYIPPGLDKKLADKFGAEVYRAKVDEWASFARYGENAIFAVNSWNKRFLEDPPEAPLVVSAKVQKVSGNSKGVKLVWNDVMKANSYRLQISRDSSFSKLDLETVIPRNRYVFYPAFWGDGVYYWRVAGIMTLNTGEAHEGPYSEAYSFAVSKPAAEKGVRPRKPELEKKIRVKKGVLNWPNPSGAKYYRMQLSKTADFDSPLVDVFTDTCAFKLSGLPVQRDTVYYMRVMGSDGAAAGDWSSPSEMVVEPPRAIPNDMRRLKRRK